MTNTEKILEEYCKKFGLCKEKGTCQCRKELKFITKIVAQAEQEMLKRVVELIDKHDPQTGKDTSPAYWGNTLRASISSLPLLTNKE